MQETEYSSTSRETEIQTDRQRLTDIHTDRQTEKRERGGNKVRKKLKCFCGQ